MYDAESRRVHVALKRGAVSVEFSVAICGGERPRVGAHPIVRVSSESWRVLQLRFWVAFRNRREVLDALPCPISDELDIGDGLLLTNTPGDVDELLEAL